MRNDLIMRASLEDLAGAAVFALKNSNSDHLFEMER